MKPIQRVFQEDHGNNIPLRQFPYMLNKKEILNFQTMIEIVTLSCH